MAGQIKGITIEFRGDTTQLDKALRKIKSDSKSVDSELKKVNTALKFNPKNVELLTQKQGLLRERVAQTTKSLEELKNVQKQMEANHVDTQSREYQQVRREIIETESKLKHFKAEADKLANVRLTALRASLDEVSKKFQEAGETLTKNLTVPLVALGTASTVAGLDFDAAMSQVAATMGTTTDKIQVLRDFALDMGKTTSFSATEAAQALNYMALAGYDVEESMRMLPVVLNLAAAGNMDLARASDAVTDAQTALGLSMDETEVLIDQMAKTASQSNTSVEQLSDAILAVGGTARGMNGGIEELNAVLGILADNGIKGSEGGTALRNVLLKLQDPTSKTAEALESLGVSAYDANGNFKDLRELFPEIAKALDGLSEAERNDILSDMFNVRDISKANALLNTSVERWDELSNAIENSTGAAGQMAETQLDNLKGELTLLKSALEGAAIAISDVLTPAIRKITEGIQSIVEKFNALPKDTQSRIVKIGVALAAIGPALILISKLLAGLSIVIGGVSTAVGFLSTALSFLAANPVVLIIAGIAALVAAIVILWNKSETFRAFILGVWQNIQQKFAALVAWFGQKKEQLLGFFRGIPAFFSNVFGQAWANVKRVFSNFGAFFGGLWNTIKNKFSAIGTSIASAISGAVRSGINGVINRIESIINGGIDLINGAINLINKIPSVNIGKIGRLNLPRLAKGGIVDSATIAMIGEGQSSEAVIPLDELWKRLDKMTDTLTGTGGAPIVVNVYGAEGQSVNDLAKAVQDRIIEMEKRRRYAWA